MKTVVTFLLSLALLTQLASAEQRLEVPSEMTVITSMEEVKAFFSKYIERAKRSKELSELSQSLFEFSGAMSQDTSKRYAALILSFEYAKKAHSARLYQQAVEELRKTFTIDIAPLVRDSVGEITKRTRDDHHLLFPIIESAIHHAIAANDFEGALELFDDARLVARKIKDSELGKKLNEFKKTIKKQQDAFKALAVHFSTLETNPTDPIAHGEIGRFECFTKGNWQRGIPHLLQGDDKGSLRLHRPKPA